MKILLTSIFIGIATISIGQSLQEIDSLLSDARYQSAIDAVNEALSKSPVETALLINRKAEGFVQSGSFKQAEETLLQAKAHSSSPLHIAVTETNYGLLYLNTGRNDLAQQSLENAVRIFDEQQLTNTLERARTLSFLGQLYNVLGKTEQAQEQLSMALHIREKLLPPTHELLAASYNDLGLAFVTTDNDKALDYYEKALRIYEDLHGKNHPKIAIANINTGLVYREEKLYGDAVNNFQTALDIWEKVFAAPHPSKAFALLNLGQTYLKMNDKATARAYFDKALAMYKNVYGTKHPDIANVLTLLGNLEISSGSYPSALGFYQQAVISNVNDFENPDPASNPSSDDYYNGKVLLYTLHLKARAFEKKYFGHSLKLKDLQTALTTLERCDKLIDRLRQQTSNENDKLTLGTIANEVFADGVRIAYEIAQNSLVRKQYLERAFYFSEKSKSAVLLEAISDAQAKSFAGIPSDILDKEKSLKSEMIVVTQKLSQRPDAAEEKSLRDLLFNLNKEYLTYIRKLETDYPQYFDLKYNATTPSVPAIQQLLENGTAVISYFVDEENNTIYRFFLTAKGFEVTEKKLPEHFDKYITGFRNAIYFNDEKTFLKTCWILSEALLPKIEAKIGRVIIIPTGRLSIIPFEALLTKEPDAVGYSNYQYVIQKTSISYEFSATLLAQKHKSKSKFTTPSIMLCAPVDFNSNLSLPPLPGTEQEVNAIARMFSAKNFSVFSNVRSAANESAIANAKTGECTVLHLATHGIVDESNPELSRIFLQPDELTDGNLFSGEIYNLKLKANLVTLSACQTGLGKISKGEGVIGLSRALVYAGAQNVIVSFWSVADESTALLMRDFYDLYLKQTEMETFGQSLRLAKLKMISSDKFSAPYYWAPFILIGD